jgi:ligand-binding sensor domain-containing protein
MLSSTKSHFTGKTLKHTLFYFLLTTQICFAQTDFWQLQGSPYGKHIQCISAGEIGKVYLSSSDAALFYSSNNGELWTITDYNHSLIQAIAIDNTGKIYAGSNGEGVFRSTDDGISWYQINDGLMNTNILSLTISPTSDILCGTDGGGVYKLINDTSWQYLGLANVQILSLLVKPNGFIYAGTSGYSVFRSTNAGTDWTMLYAGIGDDRFINALAVDSSGNIYAGTDLGVYKSTNDGDMWFQSSSGLMDTVVYELTVSPSQLILASAGKLLYVSSDGGANWEPHDFFGAAPECFSVSENGYVFAGNVLGVYRSESDITNWTRLNDGLTNAESIQSICFSSNGNLFAGLSTGAYSSDDNGITWRGTGLNDENVIALHSDRPNGLLFAGTEYGITRSTDGGETWSEKSGYYYTHKVSFGEDVSGNLYSGYGAQGWWSYYGAVLISTNFGEIWDTTALSGPPINAIFVNPSDDAVIVARADSGIYVSIDQGSTWEAKGLNVQNIISVLYSNSGCMFAGTEDGILYRSCDNGVNWQDISIPDFISISCMIFNSSGHIFLSDSNGVFLSTDNGDSWTTLNTGLTETNIHTLRIDNVGYLFAGSASGYIFKSNQIISGFSESTTDLPGSFYLYQNFPNPFNPSTSIRFSVPQRTHVQLKVFDIIGCEITTLLNEELEAGNYDITFNAGDISTGVYIYQLKAGTYMESKKMLLLR